MKLGPRQIEILQNFGPMQIHVVTSAEHRTLIAKGLVDDVDGGWPCITPAGLRALADAIETGRIPGFRERITGKKL
jgi:hypothetical protein